MPSPTYRNNRNTSIRRLNWKLVAHVVLFWVLVLSLGCLLQTHAGGSGGFGNGNGGGVADAGDGTGRADHGSGSGMSDSEGDGAGASEEAEDDEPSAATQDDGEPQEDAAPHSAAAEESEAAAPAAPAAAPEDAAAKRVARQSFEEASQRAQRPRLWNNSEKEDEIDDSADSQVISMKQAKKGLFGVEVSGRSNAVFLLDLSGSMDANTSERMSRLALLKSIFCNELDRLYRECQDVELQTQVGSFRVATFSDNLKIYPVRGAFSYGSSKDVANAKNAIRNLQTEGGTSMKAAWTSLEPILRKNRCDMVLFLSDGDPTDCSANDLLAWLRQHLPKQRISTFSLGCESPLMEQIAKNHNGKYRAIR